MIKTFGKYEAELLYSDEFIKAQLFEMASDIVERQQENLCFITIMKGGLFTASNIFDFINFDDFQDPIFGHIGLTSYAGNTTGNKHVKITSHLDLNLDVLKYRNVWLIDDITDRGLTMETAKDIMLGYGANSVKTAVLIDKPCVRKACGYPKPDVVGIVHNYDDFLIGCGMGIGEKYRYLKDLWKVIKEGE